MSKKNVAARRKLNRLPIPVRRATDLSSFDPDKALKAIGVAKAREAYYKRARDPQMVFDAVQAKLTLQLEFTVWHDGVVEPALGKGRPKKGSKKQDPISEATPDKRIVHNWRKDLCKTAIEVIDGKEKRVTVGDPEKFKKALDDAEHRALRACERVSKGTERGTIGTGEFERYTPEMYVEAVREVLGEIDLDPASNATAQKTVQAKKYFDEKKNGLKQEWHGHVFLNPPYHRDLAPAFIDKLVEEVNADRVTEAILLTNNSTDTDWFRTAQMHCAAICFTHGRIKFETPDGKNVSPTQGQAFMYFGDDIEKFNRVFADIGLMVVPYRQLLAHVIEAKWQADDPGGDLRQWVDALNRWAA
jgi:phage N-6-adenine-methyltransferase